MYWDEYTHQFNSAVLEEWSKFQTESTETKLKMELHSVTLAKGVNPVKRSYDINRVKGKFTRALSRTSLFDSDVNATAIQALSADYQTAISSTSLKTKIKRRQLNLDILIQEYRQVYKTRSLGGETQLDLKENTEIALASSEQKCFKCKKAGHVKKDCQEKNLNDNTDNNASTSMCHMCERKGLEIMKFWENPVNARKRPDKKQDRSSLRKWRNKKILMHEY